MYDLQKMFNLCKKRESEWPQRGQNYVVFKNYMDQLENYVIDISKKNKTKYKFTKKISNKKFFIFGGMKTGTTLLLNLLDGHSKICSLPVDSHLIKHFNEDANVDKDIFFKKIHNLWFRKLISPTGQEPFLILGDNIEKYIKFSSLMYENFKNSNLINFKSFDIASKSYAESCDFYKQNKNLIVLEKTPENEFFYDTIKKEYTESKFLHIVRNPLDNIISLKKNAINLNYNFLINNSLNSIVKSLYLAATRNNNQDYKVIKYESLTEELDSTIKNITNFLDIENEEILKIPTFLSKSVKNNSMFSENNKKNGVFKSNKRSKKEYNEILNDYEKTQMDLFFKNDSVKNILKYFNYF